MQESKKVLIVGGEGHGSVIAACIHDNRVRYQDYEWEVAGFVNDFETSIGHYPVLGGTNDIARLVEEGYYFSWGIHLIGRNSQTKEAFDRMQIPAERLATIVHRSAFVSEGVVLEPGCLVMANSYIGPRSHIGMGTMIKANVNMGHDVVCKPLCHMAVGAIVSSYVHMGVCANVAIGAVVLEKRKLGDYAMLGAHSLATSDIPDRTIYVGSPARFLRAVPEA